MYDTLFKLAVGVAVAIGTYIFADATINWLTGKRIHQHAYDYLQKQFPTFFDAIETWCKTTTDWASVQLQLIIDDTKILTRKLLKAIGIMKNPEEQPITIMEKYITSEHAHELGFSAEENQYMELIC
jgi:hypothetical protein